MIKNQKRILVYEDKETIQDAKKKTEEVVRIINEAQEIYKGWDFVPLSISDYEEIGTGIIDPVGVILHQAARNSELKKYGVKGDIIENMIELPSNYEAFSNKIDNLKSFLKNVSDSRSNYVIIFDAMYMKNGLVHLDYDDLDVYCDAFRIYEYDKRKIEIYKDAKSLTKQIQLFMDKLEKQGVPSNIELDERFFNVRNGIISLEINNLKHILES